VDGAPLTSEDDHFCRPFTTKRHDAADPSRSRPASSRATSHMSVPQDGAAHSRREPPVDRTIPEREAGTFATGGAAAEGPGLYRLLVDQVQDYAIFALDPGGYILSWNTGAQRLKGYTADEIIGRHFSTFYTREDLDSRKPERELAIATRTGKYEEEGWRIRKDGTHFWANVLITALRDETDTLVGFAKVTRDLTERRTAQERAIADARRISEAEAATRTKSEFLRAMSHELRTPINATLGYTELLELDVAGTLSERQREFLRRIRGSQEHLLNLVNDLLNYSRIEAGQIAYTILPLPMRGLVEEVVQMLEPQAGARNIDLVNDQCTDRLVARADRLRAEQILLNLLSNAMKFTPPGGRVAVTCEASGDRVLVSVADTGPGITPDDQEAIFEPFVQLGRSLTSSHEGAGLGLAISRDLARGMNGELSVESTPGVGSTFTLALPLA
jgi:PAS domain S-box-containing protein